MGGRRGACPRSEQVHRSRTRATWTGADADAAAGGSGDGYEAGEAIVRTTREESWSRADRSVCPTLRLAFEGAGAGEKVFGMTGGVADDEEARGRSAGGGIDSAAADGEAVFSGAGDGSGGALNRRPAAAGVEPAVPDCQLDGLAVVAIN